MVAYRSGSLAPAMWDELTTRLEGRIVVLEPLEARHEDGLFAAARHPEIWRWLAPIGSTRYLNVREAHGGLEIGWTWLSPAMWRTGANVEAKLLMLGHAFERLRCRRVEFKTDARNERSRAALAALPAKFEGIMRKHMLMPGVGVRDSAYYSVIEEEWPQVRANLERRLAAGAGA